MAFVFDFLGAKEYLSVWHSGRLVSTGLSSNTLTLKYLSHCSRKGSIDRKVEDATQWCSTESRIRAKMALHGLCAGDTRITLKHARLARRFASRSLTSVCGRKRHEPTTSRILVGFVYMLTKDAINQFSNWRQFKVKKTTVRGYDRELRNFCLFLS
jgi:hypothetical protein